MLQPVDFPAILLAGAPNCGKSVLAFLLSQRLRAEGIAHYLLRTAPDGEGDWSQEGSLEIVRQIRVDHKRTYTPELICHMTSAIQRRTLPLLVDIGGTPRGEQLAILRACTHAILFYRTEHEKLEWRSLLSDLKLATVAELQSELTGSDVLLYDEDILQAKIAGLERDRSRRRTGVVLERLVERVAVLCRFSENLLQDIQIQHAPLPVIIEKELASALAIQWEGEKAIWRPTDLAHLPALVIPGQALAIYGRGPVWLAAALAVLALPARAAIFDARYGWLELDGIQVAPSLLARFECQPYQAGYGPFQPLAGEWLEVTLADHSLEPQAASLPGLPASGETGLVLSGRLPRWYFAALARHLAPSRPWLALYVPARNECVVVFSRLARLPVGSVLAGKTQR